MIVMKRLTPLNRGTQRWLLILVLLAPCTRAAGPPTLPALQDSTSPVKSYLGKIYLLRGQGTEREIHLSRANLGIYRGQCDVALQITRADSAKSELQFEAEIVGTVRLAGHQTNVCPNFPAITKIFIAGFSPSDTPQDLSTALAKVFLRPDAYLASYNIAITASSPNSGDMESPVVQAGTLGLVPPKPVLSIDATYTEAARLSHLNGIVTAQVTVGRDGHLYSGTIINSLDPALDQRVLALLSLWRLQPAHIEDDTYAFQVSLATTFNLY
jgi:hypothetical protein